MMFFTIQAIDAKVFIDTPHWQDPRPSFLLQLQQGGDLILTMRLHHTARANALLAAPFNTAQPRAPLPAQETARRRRRPPRVPTALIPSHRLTAGTIAQ